MRFCRTTLLLALGLSTFAAACAAKRPEGSEIIPGMTFHPARLGGVPVRQIVSVGMAMTTEHSMQPRSAVGVHVGGRPKC